MAKSARTVVSAAAFKADEFVERGKVGPQVAKTRASRETVRLKSKLLITAAPPLSRAGLRRPRPAETLFAVSKAVASKLELSEVLRQTTRELVRALAADIGSVWRFDPNDREPAPVADFGAPQRLRSVNLASSLVSLLIKNPTRVGACTPVYSSDSAKDPRFHHPLLQLIPHRSVLIQPFRVNGQVAGVFAFVWSRARHRFNDIELRLVEAVTQQAGIAIENAGLLGQVHRFTEQLDRRVRDRTSRLNAAYEELRQSREELRALTIHLEKVREAERARIAREIHDELGQALTSLKMDLALLPRGVEDDHADVAPLSSAVDSMIVSVQRISSELRPQILDDLGLHAALGWYTQEFEKRTGVQCRFRCVGTPDALDADRSTALYRIFQEIMTNVARHAHARRVQITLKVRRTSFNLTVRDNGCGIGLVPRALHQRLGLLGMQERATAFGGMVTIVGKAGAGTTVRVPYPHFNRQKDPDS